MLENRERRVICIPAKPGLVMSETAKYKLTALIPTGKLTTVTSMEKYLAKLFAVHWVHFKPDYQRMFSMIMSGAKIEYPNKHRVVSDAGFVYPSEEQHLINEGFELVEDQRSNSSLKVKDFKNYLFDFGTECDLGRKDFEGYIIGNKF